MSEGPTEGVPPKGSGKPRTAFVRLWQTNDTAEVGLSNWPTPLARQALVLFWRGRLAGLAISLFAIPLAALSLICFLTGYWGFSTVIFQASGAIAVFGSAVTHGFRLWLLFKLGGWSSLGGKPIQRQEQPVRFWVWATVSIVIMLLLLAIAGFLVWSIIQHLFNPST